MKKILGILNGVIALGMLASMTFVTGCTDNGGDGIDSIKWQGSLNPEDSLFRNPVWEPSLEAGTLVKGSGTYVAIAATTQWAKGLTYCCPTLNSTDLMSWNVGNMAFTDSATQVGPRIISLSVDYARAVAGASYWMFYTVEGNDSVFAAAASTAAGPYTPRGGVIKAEGVKTPFFVVNLTSYYVCYDTNEGTFMQKVTLNKRTGVRLSGKATKIANSQLSDIAISKCGSEYFLFGTVANGGQTEIRYAKASKVTGPFLDKQGGSVAESSTGETLVTGTADFSNPENPMRGFLNTAGDYFFLAYNATQADMPMMESGFNRRPMFVTPIKVGTDGWLEGTVSPQKGWTYPRFK